MFNYFKSITRRHVDKVNTIDNMFYRNGINYIICKDLYLLKYIAESNNISIILHNKSLLDIEHIELIYDLFVTIKDNSLRVSPVLKSNVILKEV